MKPFLVVLLSLAVVAGAGGSRTELDRLASTASTSPDLLYLPNGKYLRIVSLGHAGLVADLIYLWAIQYYSDYERADRYRYVEQVFGEVISELDPHYVDPYWMGALILTVENHDLEAGLRLLDKGFERNPDQWILPYLAGWECYRARDYTRAASYFERAAQVPEAPSLVLRMRAGMFARAGEAGAAIRMWREVLEDPRSDAGAKAIAERQIRDLGVRLDVSELQAAVERFRRSTGRNPRRLEELAQAGLVDRVPLDPDGSPYSYDRRTGRVSSPAGHILRSP